jgi:hypothetical protein
MYPAFPRHARPAPEVLPLGRPFVNQNENLANNGNWSGTISAENHKKQRGENGRICGSADALVIWLSGRLLDPDPLKQNRLQRAS